MKSTKLTYYYYYYHYSYSGRLMGKLSTEVYISPWRGTPNNGRSNAWLLDHIPIKVHWARTQPTAMHNILCNQSNSNLQSAVYDARECCNAKYAGTEVYPWSIIFISVWYPWYIIFVFGVHETKYVYTVVTSEN